MADGFQRALTEVAQQVKGLQGAALTDLDGEDIAVSDREARDNLRLCAAYGGIALRRLGQIEAQARRAPIDRITLKGTAGRFMTLRVADDYQLVALGAAETVGARLTAAADTAARKVAGAL